jgi:ferredoxin-NADP reductase
MTQELIEVRLTAIWYAAEGTNLYEFQRVDGGVLPSAEAGSHISLHLPNGVVRQYSLTRAENNPTGYVVGIKRDRNSRGGSVYIHDKLKVGEIIKIEPPRNNFPLNESAEESVFIAGGIGITPIFSMINRLQSLGKKWMLYFACQTKAEAAFYQELSCFSNVKFHFDDKQGGVLDLASIIAGSNRNAHFYCCGPVPMLDNFESLTKDFPPEQIHIEYFAPRQAAATEGGFLVELAKSGKTFEIQQGESILQVLLKNGVYVSYSCEIGICGTCETKVISGTPDHRDEILSPAEKESNKTMMICCSGAKSNKLVLDV